MGEKTLTQTRYTTTLVGFLFLAVYLFLSFIIEAAILAELFNGVVFALATAVLVAYLPAFWAALTDPRPGQKQFILLGVIVSWFAIGGARGESMIWRAMGKPEWLTDHWTWIIFIYLNIMAAILHLAAPGAVDGIVPKRNWIWTGIGVGTGVAVALLVIWIIGAGELPTSVGKRDI